MTEQEVKRLFRNYTKNKRIYKEICNRIEEIETKAEKITPSYSTDGGALGFGTDSKVETFSILVVEKLQKAEKIKAEIELTDSLLAKLKSHQRYFVKMCLVYHNSYDYVAQRENTSSNNVYKIVNNAIQDLL